MGCNMKSRTVQKYIDFQEAALKEDDPKSTCAAFHRGAINAYKRILEDLQREERAEKRKKIKQWEEQWEK